MASTDLATVSAKLPAYLQGKQVAADEFAGGIGPKFPLPFLSTRGKEFRLRKDGQELNTRQREMSIILIAARPTLSKRYYKDKYETGSLEAPDCSSKDSIRPDVADPVSDLCGSCPMNVWGSKISDRGKEIKACSDYKRIVIWPTGLTDDALVLDVAATSLKAPKGQKHDNVMMLGDYLGQLAKHGLDPTQVVTKMEFTDAEYPQLCFSFERFVSEEEHARVLELRESEDVSTVIATDLFEAGGEVKEAGETPDKPAAGETPDKPAAGDKPKRGRPAKKKEAEKPADPERDPYPGSTIVMMKDGMPVIVENEEDFNAYWDDGYRQADTGKKPAAKTPVAKKKEAEPEVEESEESDDEDGGPDEEDFLSQVSALLKG